ncbi:MAG: sulfatase [Cyclobacteriaceae bacterium]|nr:sulfatase [Cyclobacteriaceae bacterium]
MKKSILLFTLLSAFLLVCCSVSKTEKHPNIVLILIDDMGWKDFGEAGSGYYETPNIDMISREGIRFTKGYSAAPVCSPSRGALLTGKYPARTKFTTVWNQNDTPVDNKSVLHSVSKQGEKNGRSKFNNRSEDALHFHCLPLSETTFADVLSENGYMTGYIGKWHCGWDEKFWPDKRGFQYAEGYRTVSVRTPHFGKTAIGKIAGMTDLKPDDYVGDKLTDKAVAFINSYANHDKPFMLMLSHYLVHGPLEGKDDYVKKYENTPATDQNKPVYAAMMQSVDESVGRILQALKDADIEENTIIIFTSDNGGLVPATSNYPLLGGKSYLFEAGMRVPFLVRWKGKVLPKVDTVNRVMHTDIFPTLLEIANIPMPPDLHFDGKSIYPLLLKEEAWSQEPVFFHFPHYTHATSPATAIIDKNWKLIRFYNDPDNDQYFLFDLDNDPFELNDLADSRDDKLNEMTALMLKYLEDIDGEMPVPNPDFDESKPGQLDKTRYYNQAIRERAERERLLKASDKK